MASLNEASVSKKYVNIKMRCPQSFPDINRKEVKLIPKPVNTILPKIEVKNKNSSQTKLLSAHEKQKTSSNQEFNEEFHTHIQDLYSRWEITKYITISINISTQLFCYRN